MAAEFFELLYRNTPPDSQVWVGNFDGWSQLVPVARLSELEVPQDRDVYFTPAVLTLDAPNKKPGKVNVLGSGVVWADWDTYKGDRQPILPPTVRIRSGRGEHLYYVLDQFHTYDHKLEYPKDYLEEGEKEKEQPKKDIGVIQRANTALRDHLKAGDGCWNIDRVLRFPGSLNRKCDQAKYKEAYSEPLPCEIIEINPQFVYTVDELLRLRPYADDFWQSDNGQGSPDYSKIDFKLGKTLKRWGFDPELVEAIIHYHTDKDHRDLDGYVSLTVEKIFNEPTIDELLERLAETSDPWKREELLNQLAALVAHEPPNIVDYYGQQLATVKVDGYKIETLKRFRKRVTDRRGLKNGEVDPEDHTDVVKLWLTETNRDITPPQYLHNQWYEYRSEFGYWQPVSNEMIKKDILQVIKAYKGTLEVKSWFLKAVYDMATVELGADPKLWNQHDKLWMLPCANGTLNLKTLELEPHNPENYITSGLEYEYIPQAESPTWDEVIEQWLPDEERSLLQEWAGYCLTPMTGQEVAVWVWGPSGTGKSTSISILKMLMSERGGELSVEDIADSKFRLGELEGKTFVSSTENSPTYSAMGMGTLNKIISGETLTIERKYREAYKFNPVAKVMWAMNDRPRIATLNDGIFRRVWFLEFVNKIASPDPKLGQKLREELPGILNWALVGLKRFQERGHFVEPESVTKLRQEYKLWNDTTQNFIVDRCDVGDDNWESLPVLYRAYKVWCGAGGFKSKSRANLLEELKRLQYKFSNGTVYGLQLRKEGTNGNGNHALGV